MAWIWFLEDADQRPSVPQRFSRTFNQGEAGVYEGGGLEAQGSAGSREIRLTLLRNVAFNIIKEKITFDLLKAYQICTKKHLR